MAGLAGQLQQELTAEVYAMPDYKAPLRDIRFVRDELLGYEAHYQSLRDVKTPPRTWSMPFSMRARSSVSRYSLR